MNSKFDSSVTERFQWIHNCMKSANDTTTLDGYMIGIARSLAEDEFYSDEEIAKGLRMATRLYNQQKERIEK